MPSRDAEAIVNFAAETHVDRSIAEPEAFIVTNMQGTHVLLEAAREHDLRYLQVSTDEVYGSIAEGSFTESSPLAPSSPYSATKTGARPARVELLPHLRAADADLPRLEQLRPYQYPEKLIPLMILNALAGDHLPVYGDGRQVRNWLFVEDFARGIGHVLDARRAGRGLQLRRPGRVREPDGRRADHRADRRRRAQIEYVTDRPGHDRRYSLASEKLQALGWQALTRSSRGSQRTVDWYRENAWWWEPIRTGEYLEYYSRHYGRALKV